MLHLYYTNSVNKLDTGYVVLNIENISLNWIFCGKYIKMLKEQPYYTSFVVENE